MTNEHDDHEGRGATRPLAARGPLRHWPTFVVLAAALAYFAIRWPTLRDFALTIDTWELFTDFDEHYYVMGRQVLERPEPVKGYLYPSFFALLMVPFAQLGLGAAQIAWGVVQVASVALLWRAIVRTPVRLSPAAAAAAAALVLTSLPVLGTLKWGQVSVLVTGLCVAAMLALQSGRRWTASGLLAVATAIKLYPAIFALGLLLRREWRTTLLFGAMTLLLFAALPLAVLGWDAWVHFETTVLGRALAMDSHNNINSQYAANIGLRWCYLLTGEVPGPDLTAALKWSCHALAALSLAVTVMLSRRRDCARYLLPLSSCWLALPFLLKTMWGHYFVYLPACQVAAFAYYWRALRGRPSGARAIAPVVMLVFVAASAAVASLFSFDLHQNWATFNGYGTLLVANALLQVPFTAALWIRAPGAED